MRETILTITAMMLLHAVVVILHGVAHLQIPVTLSVEQGLFIGLVIILSPILAVGLLWKQAHWIGTTLFLGAMAGALWFGLYNHFWHISPDHVSAVPVDLWGRIFQVTALLLAMSESAGCLVGGWALMHLRQTEKSG